MKLTTLFLVILHLFGTDFVVETPKDADRETLVAECQRIKENFQLCDWAYLLLTGKLAELCLGGAGDEATQLQFELLRQSGYQVRCAHDGSRLCLLVASAEALYQQSYYEMDGVKYYLVDKSLCDRPLLFDLHDRPEGKPFTMEMHPPKLDVALSEPRVIAPQRYPQLKVAVQPNKNLIDYYDAMPRCAHWEQYRDASLSEETKSVLYPMFRKAFKGKTEQETVRMLLDFVQTGFAYRDDQRQFGHERPLYPDETLFYPYSDCDDRAILFACLVKELTGLETVFVNDNEHLRIGVCFNESIETNSQIINGKSFVVFDPTGNKLQTSNCKLQTAN